jgi:hypothetical protein
MHLFKIERRQFDMRRAIAEDANLMIQQRFLEASSKIYGR